MGENWLIVVELNSPGWGLQLDSVALAGHGTSGLFDGLKFFAARLDCRIGVVEMDEGNLTADLGVEI